MIKNILVTGGAGYIGSACVAALVEKGHSVTVFDNLSTGQRDKVHSDAVLIEGDITDVAQVRAAVTGAQFDTVIHFAAKKAVGESEADPALYFHTNVTGSLNLLTAMSDAGVPQLIFSSTAVVYASPLNGEVLTEATTRNPQNVYGRTKAMIEDAIIEYNRTKKLSSYTIFRYFNVAGDAGLDYVEYGSPNVFPKLKEASETSKSFHIFGIDYDTRDGTCIRDYIHLADLVDAHVRAVSATTSDTYNLGTGTGYTVRELIAAFESVSGRQLSVVPSPRRPGDPAILVTNPAKAAEQLGWQPRHTLTDMVESTLGKKH